MADGVEESLLKSNDYGSGSSGRIKLVDSGSASANGPRIEICNHKDSLMTSSRGSCSDVTTFDPPKYCYQDDMVRLNVGGQLFVTSRSNLRRIPDTRLSDLSEDDANYDSNERHWFFDRNPQLFNCILDFYRTDELHFPHSICGPTIKKELIYWQIHEGDIQPCCWNRCVPFYYYYFTLFGALTY